MRRLTSKDKILLPEADTALIRWLKAHMFCNCGEPVIEYRKWAPHMNLYVFAYRDTCYDCRVVSSD